MGFPCLNALPTELDGTAGASLVEENCSFWNVVPGFNYIDMIMSQQHHCFDLVMPHNTHDAFFTVRPFEELAPYVFSSRSNHSAGS